MNVFEIDSDLIGRYERFARSFTTIRAEDISSQINAIYASQQFWPEPLIGINPSFLKGESLESLAEQSTVETTLPQVFSVGAPRQPISLHRHQEQALAKALMKRNYIVTTGTGSGKSLCFFVPIINRVLAARRTGEGKRTRAVVIYPMNALANSQREELEKFIDGCGLSQAMTPTFARYTGQESDSERKDVADRLLPFSICSTGWPLAPALRSCCWLTQTRTVRGSAARQPGRTPCDHGSTSTTI